MRCLSMDSLLPGLRGTEFRQCAKLLWARFSLQEPLHVRIGARTKCLGVALDTASCGMTWADIWSRMAIGCIRSRPTSVSPLEGNRLQDAGRQPKGNKEPFPALPRFSASILSD